MVCNACKGERTLRHDMVTSAWRQCFRRCGCATSSEPASDGVGVRPGVAGLKRGDILAIFSGGRFIVADVKITHAAAASTIRDMHSDTVTGAAASTQWRQLSHKLRHTLPATPSGFCVPMRTSRAASPDAAACRSAAS